MSTATVARKRLQVPFFRYSHVWEQYRAEIEEALLTTAANGRYILQKEVEEFEAALAEYCGVRHAIGVANATDGLEINFRAAGIGPGDEVILPSHTFIASASAVVTAGARPVFAEVGPDHLLDPSDIERRITPSTRAIMPTQLNGRTADMEAIGAIAQEYGLVLLEDSAQGLGSRFRGRMAGTFGLGGVYSFYPAKTLGSLGDAGAVVTNDDEFARVVRRIHDHGRDPDSGEVAGWGRNSRLDNLQAAVLLVKLRHLQKDIEARRSFAAAYDRLLADVPELLLPPAPEDGEHFDVFQNYEVEAEDRDGLRQHLSDHGVGTILQWGGRAVHQFPALGIDQSLPRTERVLARSLLLPMNASLTLEEVAYVADVVRGFYGR